MLSFFKKIIWYMVPVLITIPISIFVEDLLANWLGRPLTFDTFLSVFIYLVAILVLALPLTAITYIALEKLGFKED